VADNLCMYQLEVFSYFLMNTWKVTRKKCLWAMLIRLSLYLQTSLFTKNYPSNFCRLVNPNLNSPWINQKMVIQKLFLNFCSSNFGLGLKFLSVCHAISYRHWKDFK